MSHSRVPTQQTLLYVDTLSVKAFGSERRVHDAVLGFGVTMCTALEDEGMEVSRTKRHCLAPSPILGAAVQRDLSKFGIALAASVTSLGVGLAGSRKRTTRVSKSRLGAFRARRQGSRCLRAAQRDPSRIIPTGGAKGMTYRLCCGVALSALTQRRHPFVAALARSGGTD